MGKAPPPPLDTTAAVAAATKNSKHNIKRRKKKGRPSLLDLQIRSIKQQQQLNNPIKNPNRQRRSTRRNPNLQRDSDEEDEEDEEEGEEELGEEELQQREKKLDSVLDEGGGIGRSNRKRKFEGSGDVKEENHDPAGKAREGAKFEDGPSTPLPDKKLLLFILDRLQKKDTYAVFAEPVDPEELPDYHEVIEEPMDFSTVRSKLDREAYADLEQFEKDIFLICSNAMQYNAPDTVYFRQARSIQELAKKDFENLRQESDDNESETKVARRGRPPLFKNLKKSLGKPPVERATPDHPGATLATRADSSSRPTLDTRKGSPSEKLTSADPVVRTSVGSRQPDTYMNWSAERFGRNDDITGSQLKGNYLKYGKKQIVHDDSRRNTYMQPCAPPGGHDSSVFTTFNAERKLLVPVGLQAEFGYARSLARFAAKLGPVAWKVASKKIIRCLPNGVTFGPGWVGENEASAKRPKLPPPSTAASQPLSPQSLSASASSAVVSAVKMPPRKIDGNCLDEKPMPSSQPYVDATPDKHATSVSSSVAVQNTSVSPISAGVDAVRGLRPDANSLKSNVGLVRPGTPFQTHLRPPLNGFYGTFGFNNPSQMGKLVGGSWPTGSSSEAQMLSSPTSKTESSSHTAQPAAENNDKSAVSKLSGNQNSISVASSNDNLPVQQSPKVEPAPPDLNVGFQSAVSSGSGRAKKMQPDLALQL